MNPMPQLVPLLKQLRLSGILDSLEARNRQAIEAKLAYTDFLALLDPGRSRSPRPAPVRSATAPGASAHRQDPRAFRLRPQPRGQPRA